MKILIVLIVLLVGCSKLTSPEPVAALKSAVEKMAKPWDSEIGASLSKYEWKNVRYDVRKTDSLVSPYQGVVDGTEYRYEKKKLESEYRPSCRTDLHITLVFQDQKWVIKEIIQTFSTFNEIENKWNDSTDKYTNEKLSSDSVKWYHIKSGLGL